MMNRRGFIGALAGFAAGMVMDPERALWVPVARVFSIPSASVLGPVDIALIVAIVDSLKAENSEAPFWGRVQSRSKPRPSVVTTSQVHHA